MKKQILIALLALGVAGAVQAAGDTDHAANAKMRPVDRIHAFNRIDGWRAIDRDTLIIWATPSRPYLVELSRPSIDLPYELTIGVTTTAGTVHARFDDVIVDGMRYSIKAIYAIDKDTARQMKKST